MSLNTINQIPVTKKFFLLKMASIFQIFVLCFVLLLVAVEAAAVETYTMWPELFPTRPRPKTTLPTIMEETTIKNTFPPQAKLTRAQPQSTKIVRPTNQRAKPILI